MKYRELLFLIVSTLLVATASARAYAGEPGLALTQADNVTSIHCGPLLAPVAQDRVGPFTIADKVMIDRVTFAVKSPRWNTIATDAKWTGKVEEDVKETDSEIALRHVGLIGDAEETQYRLARTISVDQNGRVRLKYETTWVAGLRGNPYYVYIILRLRRNDYADTTVRVEAMRRRISVANKGGKSTTISFGLEGKPYIGEYGGAFHEVGRVAFPKLGWGLSLLRGVRNASLASKPYRIEATSHWGNRGMGTYAVELDFSESIQTRAKQDNTAVAEALPAKAAPPSGLGAQRARLCINGTWRFRVGGDPSSPPMNGYRDIRAPMPLERAFEDSDFPAFIPSGWYSVDLPIPADWNDGRRIYLRFDRIAYYSRLWVNGREIASHEGHSIPWRVDITDAVAAGASARVSVHVRASDFAKHTGIWGNVWLECVPAVYVRNVFVKPSVRRKRLIVWTWVTNATSHIVETEAGRRVMENSETALRFPQKKTIRLLPGETKMLSNEAEWQDPKLWGFPPYGEPLLYTLETTLTTRALDDGARWSDTHFQSFGFREFWTEGTRFIFNGKPFFIKGDLVSHLRLHCWNRQFAAIYFHAERAANVNFIRWHDSDFPPDEWLDVGDELGMLLEPQQYLRYTNERDLRRLLREWDGFIGSHFNHPSIVMYSADNEACSQGDRGQPKVVHVDDVWRAQDIVHRRIESLDDTRLVEEHGDVRLATAVNAGKFGHIDVFNPHPYGDPLGKSLKWLCDRYGYRDDVPIHVGEIWAGDNDPLNGWTRPAEMIRRRASMTLAFRRIAKYFSRSISSVRDQGASGASLCSGHGTLYFGLRSDGTLKFGAFDASITDEHFFTDSPNDRGTSVNLKFVRVRYPSISGVGCRATRQSVSLRYGSELNFHDATRPAYLTNIVHDALREAFEKVDGRKSGALSRVRPAEVVVCASQDGKPVGRAVVWATPLTGQPESEQGVLTDANGTAWFMLRSAGRYRFSCPRIRASRVAEVELPDFDGKAGWGFVQWVELGDAKSEVLRRRLMQPAQEEIELRVEKPNNRAKPPDLPPPRLGEFAPDDKGFITDWLVVGPMPNPGDRDSGFEGFKTDWLAPQGGESQIAPRFGDTIKARFPDTDFSLAGEAVLRWRDLHGGARVKLDALTAPEVGMDSEPPLFAVAYAFCSVVSNADQDVALAVGSDDGHAVWLNHELIGADPTHGGASPDERRYKVHLRKGPNALMVKVDQSFGGWCFFLRFLRDDEPVRDLKVVLK